LPRLDGKFDDEGRLAEFKRGHSGFKHAPAYLVGFMNGDGGVLYYGVTEPKQDQKDSDYTVEGLEVDALDLDRLLDKNVDKFFTDRKQQNLTLNFHVVRVPVSGLPVGSKRRFVVEFHVCQAAQPVVFSDSDGEYTYLRHERSSPRSNEAAVRAADLASFKEARRALALRESRKFEELEQQFEELEQQYKQLQQAQIAKQRAQGVAHIFLSLSLFLPM
jgi:hypothetical protein